MGAIARNIANKITTSGVFTSGAITNSSVTGITVLANASDGITFISSQTASNSASLSFTSGLDSTYKAYKFVCSSIHPRYSAGSNEFTFQTSTNSGSSYGVTLTSNALRAVHGENGVGGNLEYATEHDLTQSTSFQNLTSAGGGISNDADMAESGTLVLFNPSSTTYVKHWISDFSHYNRDVYSHHALHAGYFNTTSAINAIQFKMKSDNFDGTIYMYGIK